MRRREQKGGAGGAGLCIWMSKWECSMKGFLLSYCDLGPESFSRSSLNLASKIVTTSGKSLSTMFFYRLFALLRVKEENEKEGSP